MNIGIYIEDQSPDSPPLSSSRATTRVAYMELISRIAELGHLPAILCGSRWYEGEGVFSKYWILEDDEFVAIEESIRIDSMLDKARFKGDGTFPLLSPNALSEIFQDKNLSYEVMKDYHIKSELVNSKEELISALTSVKTSMAVVKVLDGNGGEGVDIEKVDVLKNMEFSEYPRIVQEFVENTDGIPGLVEGRHDLRAMVVDGKIVAGMVRTAPEGGYMSNWRYNGGYFLISAEQFPEEPGRITSEIDKQNFTKFQDRLYSLDFLRGNDAKWYVIEGNARPVLLPRSDGVAASSFTEALADKLIEMAEREK